MRLRPLAGILAIAMVTLVTHQSFAQASGAGARFDEGLAHYKAKRYSEAAEAFLAAYRIEPHGDSLYNAGLAWQAAGDDALAATAYQMALALELRTEAVLDAQKRLSKLVKGLGRVDVVAPAGSTIHFTPFDVPGPNAAAYFVPGVHTVEVTFGSGRKIERSVTVAAGESLKLEVEDVTPKPAAEPNPPPAADSQIPWRTVGWISLGVGGAAAGAAIVLGLKTLSARDDYNASGFTDADARDRTESLMHWTNICWAGAAVGVAAGATILLVAPAPSEPHVAVGLGANRVELRGTF